MTGSFYDQLLERESRVIALECVDPEDSLAQFRLCCRRTGRSIYHWNSSAGLQSLKESDIAVPGSRPLVEALRYVVQTMHYGVYLFSGFENQMSSRPMNYLIQLATEPQADDRKVVLIGSELQLPRPLERVADRITEAEQQHRRLKLRNGRWVMA